MRPTSAPAKTHQSLPPTSGIGEALTHRFANAGHDLVLVARSAHKLKALANQLETEHDIKVLLMPTDLAEPGAVQQLAAMLKSRKRVLDVLVNCAGVWSSGTL